MGVGSGAGLGGPFCLRSLFACCQAPVRASQVEGPRYEGGDRKQRQTKCAHSTGQLMKERTSKGGHADPPPGLVPPAQGIWLGSENDACLPVQSSP